MNTSRTVTYGAAIREGFHFLLHTFQEVFVIGQGLWSPWYVGNSMTDLDEEFGRGRIIDTPVSESACTGAAIGAALAGMKPIVVHPRMDFALYAMDAIVNQAAKWSHMTGGQAHPGVTIRMIINRGGEQGAQHSQALHAWFAHIPGLRVVMPATVHDARDLLIASVLCPDPVIYIDDRWLYDVEDQIDDIEVPNIQDCGPRVLEPGSDLTIVASGFSVELVRRAQPALREEGISAELVDLRVLNPFDPSTLMTSVKKTGRLLAVDGGWSTAGMSAEIIASVVTGLEPTQILSRPLRITLPTAPAPTSRILEDAYYPSADAIVAAARTVLGRQS